MGVKSQFKILATNQQTFLIFGSYKLCLKYALVTTLLQERVDDGLKEANIFGSIVADYEVLCQYLVSEVQIPKYRRVNLFPS